MQKDYIVVKNILRAAAAATAVIGVSLILFPGQLLEWFTGDVVDNKHFAIYLGTALIGFAITNWLYSKVHELAYVLPAIYGNLISLVLAIIIDAGALLAEAAESSLWLILALHVVFAGAFAYSLVLILKYKD
jgi:hypothetical protein